MSEGPQETLVVLFVGDVVAKAGRRLCATRLAPLRDEHRADLVIVNGENSAGGVGVTPKTARELFAAGADVITLGNHAFRHREVYDYLDECERIVRPANYLRANPGRGHVVVEAAGRKVGVLNLIGTAGLQAARSPFGESESRLDQLAAEEVDAVIVDFHAEMTSEKVAMGWHLDGRVAAVLGTHTHVPTADARVLPGGTAHISDVGMTGARDSVLGASKQDVLESFRTQMPIRFGSAEDDPWLNAVVVGVGPDGLATRIEQILE